MQSAARAFKMPPMESSGGATLTPTQAAALIGVHPDTIRRWADAGKLACVRTPGKHRRFKRADVLACLQSDEAA